jgi:type II secretory pathway pseudopilin PulG
LGCGVAAVVSGRQLERISPLIKAIDTAERNDFLEQLAVSQYRQQQQWQQMALTPTQLQPLSDAIQPGNAGNETGNGAVTTVTKADSVNVAQDKQFNSVTDSGNGNGNASVTDGTEAYKPLYLAVTQMKEMGVSDSKIIKEVLKQEGRNFNEGKQMLEALIQLGQQQGW